MILSLKHQEAFVILYSLLVSDTYENDVYQKLNIMNKIYKMFKSHKIKKRIRENFLNPYCKQHKIGQIETSRGKKDE
jgi:hypothetical protein